MEVLFTAQGSIVSLNVSSEKGTIKKPVPSVTIDERGISGDAHAGSWHRQVSLLDQGSIEKFSTSLGRTFAPGEFAENLTVKGIDFSKVSLLDRFKSDDVELEVTQIGKKCHGDGCAVYTQVGKCVMPKEGLFARVVRGGQLREGDGVTHLARALKIMVITMSDRAFKGEYRDKSGPAVKKALDSHFKGSRWHLKIDETILADDGEALLEELHKCEEEGFDAVITTGGTGIGPRDLTPDVVTAFCHKLIPGIMEGIRVKFGMKIPNALLSRGVAGVRGTMLVYTLPGSVKAVGEYMGEILKTMEHLFLMARGIGH